MRKRQGLDLTWYNGMQNLFAPVNYEGDSITKAPNSLGKKALEIHFMMSTTEGLWCDKQLLMLYMTFA